MSRLASHGRPCSSAWAAAENRVSAAAGRDALGSAGGATGARTGARARAKEIQTGGKGSMSVRD